MTVLELICAMSIVAIVALNCGALFLTVHKQFFVTTQKGFFVLQCLTDKNRLDGLFNSITVVKQIQDNLLLFESQNKRGNTYLRLSNNTILADGKVVVDNVNSLEIAVPVQKTKNNKTLVMWDVEYTNGYWIGGVFETTIENQTPLPSSSLSPSQTP